MENVGATTLVDWLPDARAYQDRPWYQRSLIPHELAHQWFGNLVTTENWVELLAQRGHGRVHGRAVLGLEAGPPGRGGITTSTSIASSWSSTAAGGFRLPRSTPTTSTPRGPGAGDAEEASGPERFWASINRYLTRHAFGNALSDDLRRAVLDATGRNLRLVLGPVGVPGRLSRVSR